MEHNRFTVGLTGGIGSGKTTVANMLADLGAVVIDTDVIAHQLTAPNGAAITAIKEQFGESFIADDGAMDRGKMRELVFANPETRKRLESILHPLIRVECERAAAEADGIYTIFVVPLLIESGTWKKRVSRVLVVDCPEAVQIARVMKRNGLAESQVKAILAAQASREARLRAADDIVLNDGDPAALAPEISRLHALYCSMANPR